MQRRIDHLESLVKRLIAQNQDLPLNNVICNRDSPESGIGTVVTAAAEDALGVVSSAGTTVIDGIHSVYKGVGDWDDVLQEASFLSFSYIHL
jgi:hypothetical protein